MSATDAVSLPSGGSGMVGDDDQSITHRAYVQIRAGLISCRLKPGSRLKIAQLQRDLDISQAAAREGLSRLAAEGLVTIERNSGFRAVPLSVDGYRELADACLTIELPLLRSSIARGDFAWEGALLSAYHISSRVLAQVGDDEISMDAYVRHREDFHRILFARCDNQWLMRAWSQLYAQQMRYRHTFRELARYERGLHEDHRRFLDAVIDHRVDEAVAMWRDNHDKIVAFIEANLDHAVPQPARKRRTAER
ncbi:GntR family transcriptional regulator [Novosphingobium lentum]|uniref:GntR family transcriptional regulator n=1 Tax=Novosphingobium lentum TaxID=145287 RepID=UPI00147027CA|nr:GntR family transcriptional regulator [Novosphingobium lentum]